MMSLELSLEHIHRPRGNSSVDLNPILCGSSVLIGNPSVPGDRVSVRVVQVSWSRQVSPSSDLNRLEALNIAQPLLHYYTLKERGGGLGSLKMQPKKITGEIGQSTTETILCYAQIQSRA